VIVGFWGTQGSGMTIYAGGKVMANVSDEERKRVEEEEQRKYLELNSLSLSDCSEQDLENIRFNVEYALRGG